MDPLEELSVEKWPTLQAKLKYTWPVNVAGYYALYLNFTNSQIREAFKFKVYCPYGNMENGFVSTNIKGSVDWVTDCIIFTISDDIAIMEKALMNTKRIDWSRNVCIDIVTSITLKLLDNIKLAINFSLYHVGKLRTYYLDHSCKLFSNVRCPTNTYLASINEDDMKKVDDSWPYRFTASHSYFLNLAACGFSYGLYSQDHQLLAWIFVNEYNFLTHLYCEEAYRRNGYAEYLMKYVINEQLRLGNDVYGYVAEGNDISSKLFKKLHFIDIGEGYYLSVQQ